MQYFDDGAFVTLGGIVKQPGLRERLRAWAGFAAALVCLLVCSVYFAVNIRELLYREATSNIIEITEQGAGRLEEAIRGSLFTVHDHATYLSRAFTCGAEKGNTELRDIRDCARKAGYANVRFTDPQGRGRDPDGHVLDVSEEPDFKAALAGKTILSRPFFSDRWKKPVVAFYSPVWRDGQVRGVLRATKFVENLYDSFSVSFYRGRGWSYVLDRDGDVLLDAPQRDGARFQNLFEILGAWRHDQPEIERIRQDMLAGRNGVAVVSGGGPRKVLCYVPLRIEKHWYMVSVVPEDAVLENSRTVMFYSALLCGLVLLVFLSGFILYRWERGRHRQRMIRLAYVDNLTGLHNRNYLEERLPAILESARAESWAAAVFDIDRFKMINEASGYEAGDAILRCAADVLRENLEGDELAVRGGNDMFVLILRYATLKALKRRLYDLFAGISRRLEEEGVLNGRLDFTCGIHLLTDAGITPEKVYDYADIARKSVKSRGETRIAVFRQGLLGLMQQEKEIEDVMRTALADGEFVVYLQPKAELGSGRLIGAEALVRWERPLQGIVTPQSFIPLFERNGFIVELDFYMLEELCRLKRRWLDQGLPECVVSVNMSRKHLHRGDFIASLAAVADKYAIRRDTLEIEITESAFFENADLLVKLMEDLKSAGFRLAMDDFGAGYSSLNLLKKLPIDVLKIDKEFLSEGDISQKSRAVISSIVDMARRIHVDVVCEGVETPQQAEFLMSIDCRCAQGFLYARPMPAASFERLLREGARLPETPVPEPGRKR